MSPDAELDGGARRLAFSSAQLPAKLGERARRNRWRDIYSTLYGPLEVTYAADRPFSAAIEFRGFGALGLTTSLSTVERFVRSPRCVAAAGSDAFHLALNLGSGPMLARQLGRETAFEPGSMALVTDSQPGVFGAGANNRWVFVTMGGRELARLVRHPEDLVATPLNPTRPATRHLRRYLDLVLEPSQMDDDTSLQDHIETTLLDLVGLALGGGRDDAELSRVRGLRAARLRVILAAIQAGFDAPDFSVSTVAARIQLSPRYVQDLLHETGRNLTERVLEQRLQKARALLTDARQAHRRIIDIALDSGFSDTSYFSRAFRRRFGMAPSDMRNPTGG
jgi:AraC-like DNA-binding protein